MKGVEYVIDDSGRKTAVIIDLAEWGELWEDFQDAMVSQSRMKEPRVSWEDLKAEMKGRRPKLGKI